MTIDHLLPWLNLLLMPALALLVQINARLVRLEATQAHHAETLRTLQTLPAVLAGVQAVQAEHTRRIDGAACNHHQPIHN